MPDSPYRSFRDYPWACAVDSKGKRYTTAIFGADGDWWQGATILTQAVVDQLLADGEFPLALIDPETGEVCGLLRDQRSDPRGVARVWARRPAGSGPSVKAPARNPS